MILLQDQTKSNIPTPGSKINLGYYRSNQEIHADMKTGNILIQRDWNRNKSLTSSWKNLLNHQLIISIVVHTAAYYRVQ